jgi:hypothetical protein
MNKSEVIKFFGGSQVEVAKKLDITKGAVSHWNDDLSRQIQDSIIATAVRKGFLPKLIKAFPQIREARV